MNTNKKAGMFIHCCIGFAVFYIPGTMAQAPKVDVCHIPPGNPDNVHTISISENAVAVHMDHGDSLGRCEPQQTDESGAVAQVPQVDVCHVPPEKPDNIHTITISQDFVCGHLDHSDNIGACDPEMISAMREKIAPAPAPALAVAPSTCACPKPGVWRVTNLDGWMECSALGVKRKLTGAGKNDGAIWILNDDCSTIFSVAYEKEREDVLVHRGRECLYFGVAPGEEDGAEVIFDGAYKFETNEFLTGEFYLDMSGGGVECDGYRPFTAEFIEPLDEKKYGKLEAEMQKELEKAHAVIEENRERIDKYLEETDGGLAFGGRNAQE